MISTFVFNESFFVKISNDASSINEAKALIPSYLRMQNRVITSDDLLARIYTMPTNFGKIYRAEVVKNKYSNSTKDLYVICKDNKDNLTYANDAVKINLSNYLNELRVIGDEINIVDAPIVNVAINITIKAKSNYSINDVIQKVYDSIIENVNIRNMSINQGINVNNILYTVLNTEGVLSVVTPINDIVKVRNSEDNTYDSVIDSELSYSNNTISIYNSIKDGIIYPPEGGIFELKYITNDITVRSM